MHASLRHLTTMLVALLLTWGLCEVALQRAPVEPSPTDQEILEDFQLTRLRTTPGGSVILLGDSSLGNAVDETLLSHRLGVPCRNLALTGSFGLHGDLLLLREICNSSRKPTAVVIMHAPSVWNQTTNESITKSLAEKTGKPTLGTAGRRVFGRLPSSEKSRSVKTILFSRGTGLNPTKKIYQSRQKRKEQVLTELPRLSYIPQGPRMKIRPTNAPAERTFVPNADSRAKLEGILRLAGKHGIEIIIAVGPRLASDALASNTYASGLETWLHDIVDSHPRARLLYGRVPTVPPHYIGDTASHVTLDARPHFTKWFASLLSDPAIDHHSASFSGLWPESDPTGTPSLQALTEIPE